MLDELRGLYDKLISIGFKDTNKYYHCPTLTYKDDHIFVQIYPQISKSSYPIPTIAWRGLPERWTTSEQLLKSDLVSDKIKDLIIFNFEIFGHI